MAAIFCKRPQLLRQSIVLHENARHHTPNWTAVLAVHLIGFGSVSILRSVFYLSLNPWDPRGWQVIAVDADVKQVITSWLQTLNKCLYPWYHCGANAEMVVVNTLRSDNVPSASHVPCTDRSHNNILTWEYLLPYFLKVLYIYTLRCEQVSS